MKRVSELVYFKSFRSIFSTPILIEDTKFSKHHYNMVVRKWEKIHDHINDFKVGVMKNMSNEEFEN